MVTSDMLAGYWNSPPGGGIDFRLTMHRDGHGSCTFWSLVETGQYEFTWLLSDSGDYVTFSLRGPAPAPTREILSFGLPWEVTFTPLVHEFGFVRDMLKFRRWQESMIIKIGNGEKLEIPAQWATSHFYRGARLRAVEAIRIAEQAAASHGHHLSEYQNPVAHFEFDNESDKAWSIFFDTKDLVSKRRLVLRVDDETEKTEVMAGG